MTPYHLRKECAICFSSQYSNDLCSPQRFYSTICNHHFHFDCLYKWCYINNTCPTCRSNNVMILENSNNNNINIINIDNVLNSLNFNRNSFIYENDISNIYTTNHMPLRQSRYSYTY